MRKFYLLMICLGMAGQIFAQSTANYSFTTSTTGSLTDMSSGTTDLLATGTYKDDAASAVTNIGFDFVFMGTVYSQFSANSNGQMRLGNTGIAGVAQSPTASTALIAPISGDNSIQSTGKVHYKITGSTPNRILVVEWVDLRIPLASETGATYCKFQALLYEGSGKIEFRYGRMYNMGIAQSRSIYFASGTSAGQIGQITTITGTPTYNSSATSLTTTSFTASSNMTNLNSTADGSRTIYTFTPPAAPTAPSSLSFTGVASSTMTLTWTDNATTETGYVLMRSTDGVNYTAIANLSANSTSYQSTGLTPNTTYYWKVQAINEGALSSALAGTRATSACPAYSGTMAVGPTGTFPNLTFAIGELTACGYTGNIILELQSTYVSTGETFPITFTSALGSNASKPITIRPATGATGLTITSANATGTINLNSASYIAFDGRPGGSGAKDLVIANTNLGTSYAVQFINDANNNAFNYCKINSRNNSTTSGTIVFSTTTGSNGNDNNIINNCDIYDGASTPYNAIYSLGSSTSTATHNSGNTISSCNIYNFSFLGGSAVGVLIGLYNTDWTITGNSFYQTATRTKTSVATDYAINISNSGNNFTITNNFIGGSVASCGGTPWTVAGAFANKFVGMNLSVGTTTASSVQGNIINNFDFSTSGATTTGTGNFCGISVAAGSVNIGNASANTIGSSTVDKIKLTSTTSASLLVGIYSNSASPGIMNISNNMIYGLTNVGSGAAIGGYVAGISTAGSANYTINGNTIGSVTVANSIRAGVLSTTTGATYAWGVYNTANGAITISNNTIGYLVSYGTNNSSEAAGVALATAIATTSLNITGNTIRNISGYLAASATTSLICGINQKSASANNVNISQNTIFNIENANASATTAYITGILLNGTGSTNSCTKNLIYNLSYATTTASNEIRGIYLATSGFTLANNMVRLGYDVSGTVINKDVKFYGIATGGGYANVYHNSIFIGGTGVTSGSNPSAAFRMSSPSGTFNINNNVFYNARTNAGGTGKHYACDLAGSQATFKVYSDYNVYYAPNTGGVLFNLNMSGSATDYATLQAFRFNFNHGTASAPNFQDMHSGIADPKFIAQTAATPNLHIQTGVPTPVEASGIAIAAITEDIDGDVRSNLTPTDIGADAAIFNSMDDKFTPNISYANIVNATTVCGGTGVTDRVLSNVAITDVGTGVPTSGANVPRIWYSKNSTGIWYSSPGTLTSGNGNNGVWSFTITYSDMGGVVLNDVVKYYVDAQDQAATPNIWYTLFEAAAPLHSSVTTQTTPPANPNNFSFVAGFSGTYYIPSGTYKSLSCNNVGEGASPGIFQAINSGVLTGDVTIIIDGNITETGTNSLNQWIEDCGSVWKVTIRPNSATERLISGDNSSITNGLINFNSPDRVLVDGSFNGAGQYLRFRNINTSGVTMNFANNCVNDTVRNCFIEGNSTSATRGVLSVASGSTISDACNHLYFENNDVRDLSSAAGYPNLGIYINTAYTNNITFKNNRIYNWVRQGITANSVGDSIVIDGNHLYTSQTYSTQKGIQIIRDNSVDGKAHTIKNNYIGGQAANCGGSALLNSTSGSTFYGIDVSIGNSLPTTIEGNVIKNITMNQATATNFYGIYVGAGQTSTGLVEVKNNIIGGSTAKITTAGTGNYHGIDIQSQNPNSLVQGNTISYIENSNAGTPKLNGIILNVANVKQNRIFKLGTTVSSGANIFGVNLNTTVNQSYEISNNQVSLDGGSASNPNYLIGIYNQANSSGTISCMYNTCYIYGTASSTNNSYPYYRTNIGNIAPVINNILVNERTGGTGAHLAIGSQSTSNWNSNYNLLVSKSSTVVGRWSTTNYDLSNWKSNASSDYSSWYAVSNATSDYANVNIANLFVDAANGNLNINTANQEAWFVFGKGIAGASSGNISTDFAGNTRGTTSGYGTCIGAHQFAQPAVAPIASNQTGTLSAGNTTTYTFGNRTICAIDWTAGTPPTAMDVKYYSGCDEPNKESGNNYHNYYVKCTPTGGSGYTYTMNLRFDQAFTGDLPTITDTRLAKYSSSWYYAADNAPSSVVSAEYILTTAGLTSFSSFTGSKKGSTLPIELIQFTGNRTEKSALLHWTTATEINNNYFELLRSDDMQEFEVVATIDGAGNSNSEINYTYSDLIPKEMNGGIIYYKLKQVDFDGKSTMSNVIALQPSVNSINSAIENVWVNSSEELKIDYFTTKNSSIIIQLLDASGKMVYWSQRNTKEGVNEFSISLNEQMKPGLYLIRVFDGIDTETKKIIIK